ncbi:PREDICTED: uncharacterized protein LOC106748594, partial [Dinoponera quadriceps]|uniref:Uncharacterized protein LOC106748594 n=1 Tax=Dinoponera quadriceps TaxID=609295 RepID=A0A6P3XW49_DINQU
MNDTKTKLAHNGSRNVHLLETLVRKISTKKKIVDVISVEERLILTIRYLASGDEIISLAIQHRIGESTARQIVYNTCSAIYNTLSPIYLRPPVQQVWRNISKGFERDWNLPNCIGAVDGKHILIRAPPHSGSLFFNYKKTYSIALLAACNH